MKMILVLLIMLLSFFFGYSQDTIQAKKVYVVTVIKSKNTGKVVKLIKHKKTVKCGYIIHVKDDVYIVDGKKLRLYAKR